MRPAMVDGRASKGPRLQQLARRSNSPAWGKTGSSRRHKRQREQLGASSSPQQAPAAAQATRLPHASCSSKVSRRRRQGGDGLSSSMSSSASGSMGAGCSSSDHRQGVHLVLQRRGDSISGSRSSAASSSMRMGSAPAASSAGPARCSGCAEVGRQFRQRLIGSGWRARSTAQFLSVWRMKELMLFRALHSSCVYS